MNNISETSKSRALFNAALLKVVMWVYKAKQAIGRLSSPRGKQSGRPRPDGGGLDRE